MLLKKLIDNCPSNFSNIKVKGLCSDTRKLKKGDLFFAVNGTQKNGEKFRITQIQLYKDGMVWREMSNAIKID